MLKKILLFLAVIVYCHSFSQEIKYQEYSYTEFFKLIEKEKDSVFKLNNAIVSIDLKTDSTYIVTSNILESFDASGPLETKVKINKHLILNNVQFKPNTQNNELSGSKFGVINNISFERSVTLNETLSLSLFDCVFKGRLTIKNSQKNTPALKKLIFSRYNYLFFLGNKFHNGLNINIYSQKGERLDSNFIFNLNTVQSDNNEINYGNNRIRARLVGIVSIQSNKFIGRNSLIMEGNEYLRIVDNLFLEGMPYFEFDQMDKVIELEFQDNNFQRNLFLDFDTFKPNFSIGWSQLKNKIISEAAYLKSVPENSFGQGFDLFTIDSIAHYFKHKRYAIKESFKAEVAIRGQFYKYYKEKMDTEYSNQVYVEIKELETERTKILYEANPSFDKFFKWRINQFLKVFSNYGTEPERAVIVSLYVIFFFAFIYLLFPNTWDRHGKNRIMDRYRFFTKYMKKDAGIHEVYLEDQEGELLESEDFKQYMLASGKNIPAFFLKTALPLYKWSISSTKFSAALLKRVDVMQGTWSNVPDKKRTWKTILLIGAFCVALMYDLFIKVLNALMLSINTFTTLGFGEIPIKGLPRYLAIIQGFIGWFMLTIFSVSLISQLLN